MSAQRMTPGPWEARKLDFGDGPHIESTWTVEHGREWVVSQATKADARAIACLPELVEAAHRSLPLLIRLGDFIGNGDIDKARADSMGIRCDLIRDLRRILARIGGDNERQG